METESQGSDQGTPDRNPKCFETLWQSQLGCPERTGKEKQIYLFCVAFFDHCYWITGSVLGAAAGKFITFNTEGIDFAMAALFIVILVDLCRKKDNWLPAVVGAAVTGATLLIFIFAFPAHINKMLLPAMLLMVGVLLLLRKKVHVEGAV